MAPVTPATPPPWSQLPPDLGERLRPALSEVSAAVIAALPGGVPAYARPLEGAFGQGIRQGVEVALGRFLDLPGTSQPALSARDRSVYVALGRGELRQGRELETLLAAYRVGAREAFRRFAAVAQEQAADADTLVTLAEAVFAYIDELSSASADGYSVEQSLRAGETGRRRAALLGLLLAPRVDVEAVRAAASAARWSLPDALVAVTLPLAASDGLAVALGDSALLGSAVLDEHGELAVALVPAPGHPDAVTRLDRRLADRTACVGPERVWTEVLGSARLAARGSDLLVRGLVAGDPVHVERHLADLVVHRDPELTATLGADCLAPLAALRPGTAERLAETLLSWLRHRGERQHVAAELHVHPQTVGYRLGQLRELFGSALDEPDGRFALELALRAGQARKALTSNSRSVAPPAT